MGQVCGGRTTDGYSRAGDLGWRIGLMDSGEPAEIARRRRLQGVVVHLPSFR